MKNTRKAKTVTYNIEMQVDDKWLWVIMSPFRDEAAAHAAVAGMVERNVGSVYRVVPC